MNGEHPYLKVRDDDDAAEAPPPVRAARNPSIGDELRAASKAHRFRIAVLVGFTVVAVTAVLFVTRGGQETAPAPAIVPVALKPLPIQAEPIQVPRYVVKLAPIPLVPFVASRRSNDALARIPRHADLPAIAAKQSAPKAVAHAPVAPEDASDAMFGAAVVRYVPPDPQPAQTPPSTQVAQTTQTAPASSAVQAAAPSDYRVASIVTDNLVLIGSRQHGKLRIVPHHVGDRLPDGSTITKIDVANRHVLTSAGLLGSL